MTKVRVAGDVLLLFAFLVLGAGEAAAHGDAILEGPDGPVAAGQEVGLRGRGFVPGERHRLILRGTLEDHELRTVTAEADSTFVLSVQVPRSVRPGQYRIIALAPDGDEVATLDLPVTGAPASGQPEGSAGTTAGEAPGGPGPEARADEMVIQRDRTGFEWGVIGLVIGLAGGLGIGLLRRG